MFIVSIDYGYAEAKEVYSDAATVSGLIAFVDDKDNVAISKIEKVTATEDVTTHPVWGLNK